MAPNPLLILTLQIPLFIFWSNILKHFGTQPIINSYLANSLFIFWSNILKHFGTQPTTKSYLANSLFIFWTYIQSHFGTQPITKSYLCKFTIHFMNIRSKKNILGPNPLVIHTFGNSRFIFWTNILKHFDTQPINNSYLANSLFVFGRLHPQSFCQPITKYLTFLYSFFRMYILKTFWHPLNYQSHTLQIPHSSLKHTSSNISSPNSLPFETCIHKHFVTQVITKSRLPTREYPHQL